MLPLVMVLQAYKRINAHPVARYLICAAIWIFMFASMLALAWIKVFIPQAFATNLMWLVIAVTLFYYITLDFLLAALSAVVWIPMALIANWLSSDGPTTVSIWLCLGCLVISLGLQLTSMLFTRRLPLYCAEPKNLWFAPLYAIAVLSFHLGLKQQLKQELDD